MVQQMVKQPNILKTEWDQGGMEDVVGMDRKNVVMTAQGQTKDMWEKRTTKESKRKEQMSTKEEKSSENTGDLMYLLFQRALRPCHRRAGTQIHTVAGTDGQRCTELQEALSLETVYPSQGHHQGTNPNRDCNGRLRKEVDS